MIRISTGKQGSGKTLCEVRSIKLNMDQRKTYSNIKTKIKHCIPIKASMIAQKVYHDKKDKTKFDLKVNLDYWKKINESINIVLDEAHNLIDSRRSMTKVNKVTTDWIALLRRILGESSEGYGELVMITQLPENLDLRARELCTEVRHHVMEWTKYCPKCNLRWIEDSEMSKQSERTRHMPDQQYVTCPRCDNWKLKKCDYIVHRWFFESYNDYDIWKTTGQETFYDYFPIRNIEKYFGLYDTFQISDMISELYD